MSILIRTSIYLNLPEAGSTVHDQLTGSTTATTIFDRKSDTTLHEEYHGDENSRSLLYRLFFP